MHAHARTHNRDQVDFDEATLAHDGDMGSAAAQLVLNAMADALARNAAASWLDSATWTVP